MRAPVDSPSRRARLWRLAAWLLAGLIVVLAAASQVGRVLLVQDEAARTDAMLVLSGARADRWLEAADLYLAGVAPRIVLSAGRPDGAEVFLRARGVTIPSDLDRVRSVLRQLGVPGEAVEPLPGEPDNTAQEATLFHNLVRERGWRAVTIVTSKLHTRRARLAFWREFAGSDVEVSVRASRYDRADPAHWWRDRADVRETFIETVKLVAYLLGLGG
jgi:uncharacterized SAM-binding protein YcdF (DUF218 family)